MTRVLYEKRGRRYHPVAEYDSLVMDAMPAGAHLVVVHPGIKSTRYNVTPAHAAVLASIGLSREKLLDAMRQASDIRPSKVPMTQKEQKAWKAYCDVMGRDEMLSLTIPSGVSIIDALEQAIVDMTGQGLD